MFKNKKILALGFVLIMIFLATSAYAYNLISFGYRSSNLNVHTLLQNDSRYKTSVSAWENAVRGVSITNNYRNTNEIKTVNNAGDSAYGRYTANSKNISGRATRFTIVINEAKVPNNKTFFSSVLSHELGHALMLGHNDDSTSIMSYKRDRYKLTKPNSDDVRGVKAAYGL